MDGAALLDSVHTSMETELDRLGSEKSLLAATEARLESDPVLVTAATVLLTARETLADWEEEATDDAAADALDSGVTRFDDALDTVRAELDGDDDVGKLDAPFLLLEADGDVGRVAAGTVGLPLVVDRLLLQTVSFFVNEADEARADLFRDLRTEMDELLADGQDTLDALCAGDEDWDRAEAAATAVVEAAYDDYAQRLDAMGFDPKPIC